METKNSDVTAQNRQLTDVFLREKRSNNYLVQLTSELLVVAPQARVRDLIA